MTKFINTNKQKEIQMKTALKFLALYLGLSSVIWAANAPLPCYIKTYNGRYLTAVGGGGRTTDVLHTDATWARAWERFVLIDLGDGSSRYGIKTNTGHFLSAINGGGRITDVIHSNRTQLLDWEKFRLVSVGNGWYAIQTFNGYYLTAVNGGGRITDVIHSDATRVGTWEMFFFNCSYNY
jgi:hypothetical protein